VQATQNADFVLEINRTGNDGGLVRFYQDTVEEGSISVSGTTVSYNGAHLSRWSQLPTGAEREEILRGTLLSNLDEMCEWGDEENEQLNRMKVSDVPVVPFTTRRATGLINWLHFYSYLNQCLKLLTPGLSLTSTAILRMGK
jgi:hypothetical protein